MTAVARSPAVPYAGVRPVVGLAISLAMHALVFGLVFTNLSELADKPEPPARERKVTVLILRPPEPEKSAPEPEPPVRAVRAPTVPLPSLPVPEVPAVAEPVMPRHPASMAAPSAPTAEEWAFASTYKLKNSKGYRYTWGQQVRSMMGTAVEGPDQGMVRFRVEIAPDGTLTRLDTLWSTSAVAERLARQAIGNMPRWPTTPTGKPLIFEKTLSFSPFASDGPPLYKDACLPDPPVFSNPFAWDGTSPRMQARAEPTENPDPQTLEDCLKQLPKDSIEAESARDQRLMDPWGWGVQQTRSVTLTAHQGGATGGHRGHFAPGRRRLDAWPEVRGMPGTSAVDAESNLTPTQSLNAGTSDTMALACDRREGLPVTIQATSVSPASQNAAWIAASRTEAPLSTLAPKPIRCKALRKFIRPPPTHTHCS